MAFGLPALFFWIVVFSVQDYLAESSDPLTFDLSTGAVKRVNDSSDSLINNGNQVIRFNKRV